MYACVCVCLNDIRGGRGEKDGRGGEMPPFNLSQAGGTNEEDPGIYGENKLKNEEEREQMKVE